jgi:hypothetical protein
VAEFKRAPEVAAIARQLIEAYHPHLLEVRIEYVWGDEAPVTNDKVTRGKAMKISGVDAELARLGTDEKSEPFFCIVIYSDEWLYMKEHQQRALVDHELCHLRWKLDKEGKRKLYLQNHDLEEFHCIVERHGFWKREVAEMNAAMQKGQHVFIFEEPGASPSEEASEPRTTSVTFSPDVRDKLRAFRQTMEKHGAEVSVTTD